MSTFMVWLALLWILSGVQEMGTMRFQILDEHTGEPLHGATAIIRDLSAGASSGPDGLIVLEQIPAGLYRMEFRYVGYETVVRRFRVPFDREEPVPVFMHQHHGILGEVTISSTRTTRSISDAPTRIEVIDLHEIEEKINMRPGDISLMLAETQGIQVIRTSPASGSSNFRIQGLDGRYTQLLKDGFPLYSGFSAGLSIMQIPPLDLYQVELIKGASSTLYGGGAVAGLINLISKSPGDEPELSFLANASSSKNLDLSGYFSRRFGRVGVVVFATHHNNPGYDPSDQGFSAVPKFQRYTLNPRLEVNLSPVTKIMADAQWIGEYRLGGDMQYIQRENRLSRYFEQHDSQRLTTRLALDHQISSRVYLSLKNSFSLFDRSIRIPDYRFGGNQRASFNEGALSWRLDRFEWIGGLNFWTDRFEEKERGYQSPRNYSTRIYGLFLQNTTEISPSWVLESGFRADRAVPAPADQWKGWFFLPRFSALYKMNHHLSMRLGGGMGYNMPDMFIDSAENLSFRGVLPLKVSDTIAERSYGLNFDLNFRTIWWDHLIFRLNQLFFLTRVDNPLELKPHGDQHYIFSSFQGNMRSRGIETNAALIYDHYQLFLGYTYVHAVKTDNGLQSHITMNSPHQASAILMIEEHGDYRLGIEGYYYSPPYLRDQSKGRGYTIFGIMSEKTWGAVTVFFNLENIFDTRQTRFGSIYTGPREHPEFKEIYAPMEGRYLNGGFRLSF